MFGFFKKKKLSPVNQIFMSLEKESIDKISIAAKVIMSMQMSFQRQPNYIRTIHSKFIRGYTFGYFETAITRFGLPNSQDETILRVIIGHAIVFGPDIDAIQFVKDSINLQDDPEYAAALQTGMEEFSDAMDKSYSLHKLRGFYLDNCNA